MGWGDFKRSVGLNKLNTRAVTSKVAKVIPGAALAVPSRQSLAAGAQALQTYSKVPKAIKTGKPSEIIKAGKEAVKFAKSADKNPSAPPRLGAVSLPALTAPGTGQIGGQSWSGLTNGLDSSDAMNLPQVQDAAAMAGDEVDQKIIIVSLVGLLGLFLFARAVK